MLGAGAFSVGRAVARPVGTLPSRWERAGWPPWARQAMVSMVVSWRMILTPVGMPVGCFMMAPLLGGKSPGRLAAAPWVLSAPALPSVATCLFGVRWIMFWRVLAPCFWPPSSTYRCRRIGPRPIKFFPLSPPVRGGCWWFL